MKKVKIALLGATGSIGMQTLEIVKNFPKKYDIVFASAKKNKKKLEKICKEFNIKKFYLGDNNNKLVSAFKSIEYDVLLNALVGIAGLIPTYEAALKGKKIALANKEALVVGGDLIIPLAKKTGAKILPIDSEHSAIFQALNGEKKSNVEKIILTASGGPFFNKKKSDLEKVKFSDVLNHPTWEMGNKITVDSATMMNKGFEVIEAFYLFGGPYEKIKVVIHKESILHSAVQFSDGGVIAELGEPDMKLPISYALSHPSRNCLKTNRLDLIKHGSLNFFEPDIKTFQCLKFAYDSKLKKNSYRILLNALDEIFVKKFLDKKIKFIDIQNEIARGLKKDIDKNLNSIDKILKYNSEIWKEYE